MKSFFFVFSDTVLITILLCFLRLNLAFENGSFSAFKSARYGGFEEENYESSVLSLWKTFPVHFLVSARNISENCSKAMNVVMKKVEEKDLDALKMFDSSAKLPAGLLNGNVNQYGDFEECLSIKWAKYCLAEIDLRGIWKWQLSDFKRLVHSHFMLKGEFNDPKHRVPSFTTVKWAQCIPSECTEEDLKAAIEETTGAQVLIDHNLCQNRRVEKKLLTFGDYFARTIFTVIFLLVLTSTLFYKASHSTSKSTWKRIFFAFSLQNSTKDFLNTNSNKTQLRAVHGIRSLSAFGLLISHKTMALLYNPYINRTFMAEHFGKSWAVIGRTAIIYTDSFMFISGLLNAKALLEDLERRNTMRFKEKIINRIFRISPNIVAVILFCTYILPSLGEGPLWPLVVNYHSDLCKQFMWRNFLYIHNYFGFENMCLTHTHQVGIDMQLFIVTPLIVALLWKNREIGFIVIGVIAAMTTFLRIWATWKHDLSHMIYFGITISKMFDTANYSYILPTHRATIYLMGVSMAYILKFSYKKEFFTNKITLTSCWILALTIGFLPMFGPYHMSQKDYTFNKYDALIYAALAPVFWGIGLSWVIFASNRNRGGFFGDFLSWKGFEYFNKISYAVYLVQFPVFFYNVGIKKHVDQFSIGSMFPLSETLTILIISIILTLFIEVPFQSISKILFNSNSSRFSKKASFEKSHINTSRKLG